MLSSLNCVGCYLAWVQKDAGLALQQTDGELSRYCHRLSVFLSEARLRLLSSLSCQLQ